MEKNIEKIAQNLSLKTSQVETVLQLTQEGNTIPFIARYRKEMTGSLDEVQIKEIIDSHNQLEKLDDRKATVLAKIEEQGKLTDELRAQIEASEKLQEVEDLYLPYKEKRRTKATIARENGLFPLAKLIMQNVPNIEDEAEKFVNENVKDGKAALDGALAILSEAISEDVKLRNWTLSEIKNNSRIASKVKDESLDEKKVFQMYYDFDNDLSKLPNYRVLALNRGEKLGILSVKFENNDEKIERFFETRFNARNNKYLSLAIKDSTKKKIIPAMERQIRSEITEAAEDSAIKVFSENLRNLLLVAPLKGKVILGFDPAFRTGAKLAVVDETGKLLETKVIYPVKPAKASEIEQAKKDLAAIIKKYGVEMIAIGNGTASRESESFVSEVIKNENLDAYYVIVNESGASIYSASELARKEFPELTVEKRSAISIARRLQDPLAELVKIDPQSIGVGQYQHDVSDKKLAENLDFVVETVVNQVGVNVNTASPALLSHVSGLNKTIAENIVKYREENGALASRSEIKKVPRLGAKAFEQAAGFLRIPNGKNVLDNTGVHPESYNVVKNLLNDLKINDLDDDARKKLENINYPQMAEKLEVGQETLRDIVADLMKPGRDMRDSFDAPVLRQDVLSIKDLSIGQKLEGVVRNVVDFGAFVDIGIKEDGLIHISKISKNFIKHPSEVVAVGEIVTVWVDKIDNERGKVNLSLLDPRG
ncbi:RNA-binding transcriptional accessory protein [Floricoccus penangensis]|uniref:RNA-binding transcriptional accessory protein n=1 Tax=Floricoccus penangensis TaxID=1859475 RepID=A0A9Q5JFQ4_9LACT|nr:Tex family protein [Floricoccus penangensis]OFI46464.1 RNA-binding transcriptional accessory protein [Floricoccus penangensis]